MVMKTSSWVATSRRICDSSKYWSWLRALSFDSLQMVTMAIRPVYSTVKVPERSGMVNTGIGCRVRVKL